MSFGSPIVILDCCFADEEAVDLNNRAGGANDRLFEPLLAEAPARSTLISSISTLLPRRVVLVLRRQSLTNDLVYFWSHGTRCRGDVLARLYVYRSSNSGDIFFIVSTAGFDLRFLHLCLPIGIPASKFLLCRFGLQICVLEQVDFFAQLPYLEF
eukprot:g726.t1